MTKALWNARALAPAYKFLGIESNESSEGDSSRVKTRSYLGDLHYLWVTVVVILRTKEGTRECGKAGCHPSFVDIAEFGPEQKSGVLIVQDCTLCIGKNGSKAAKF